VQYSAYGVRREGGGGGFRWGGSLGSVVFNAGTYWCYWKPLRSG